MTDPQKSIFQPLKCSSNFIFPFSVIPPPSSVSLVSGYFSGDGHSISVVPTKTTSTAANLGCLSIGKLRTERLVTYAAVALKMWCALADVMMLNKKENSAVSPAMASIRLSIVLMAYKTAIPPTGRREARITQKVFRILKSPSSVYLMVFLV